LLFNVTFAVVLVSLVVQGTTINSAARLFRVQVPMRGEPLDRQEVDLPVPDTLELVQMRIEPGSRGIGQPAQQLVAEVVGQQAACMGLIRDGQLHAVVDATPMQAEDIAVLLLPIGAYHRLVPLFTRLPSEGPLGTQKFFGEFVLDGEAQAADLATVYDAEIPAEVAGLTVSELLVRRLGRPLVVGDRVSLGSITLTVREIEAGRPVKLGLKLN
jgi:potassium/hydrogen antiporter